MLTEDLNTVLGLEGCLSGNVPAGRKPAGGTSGPCARLARTKPARVVFGPGTFLNTSVEQIADGLGALTARQTSTTQRAGRAAEKLALARGYSAAQARQLRKQAEEVSNAKFLTELLKLAVRYGLGVDSLPPRLDNPKFVARLVFDPLKPAGTPKTRFASIFPGKNGALIQIRLRDNLDNAQRRAAIDDIRSAVAMPQWRLSQGRYGITGAPVIVQELSSSLSSAIVLLLLVAVAIMALTLLLVFKATLRLLPLLVALCACAIDVRCDARAGDRADDGDDRRRADPDRARRRLCDPAPDADPGGGGRRWRTASGASRRVARRRSSSPRRPRRRASSCCCSRPCRWCAASACCSSRASRSRSSAR